MKSALTVVLFRLFTIGVFVDGKEASNVSVMEGDSVTLKSGVTDVHKDDIIEWRFKRKLIDTFGDGLQLDSQTGDLKISNIRTKDSGLYEVKISSTRPTGSSEMEFNVKVVSADKVKSVSVIVNVGDSVTLQPDPAYIQGYDVIRWRFGQQKSLVAEINRTAVIFNTSDGTDERFRGRLTLNNLTGSLTITNTRTTDSGLYEAEISSGNHTIHKSFSVTVSGNMTSVSVKERESVTLQINVTKIQSDDLIVWMFGNFTVAKFNKTGQLFCTSDVPDERFRLRLALDRQNGSLTIVNINSTHAGDYDLKIISSRHIINRRITVTVSDSGLQSVSGVQSDSGVQSVSGVQSAVPDAGVQSGSGVQSAVPGSGLSSGAVAGIALLAAAVGVAVGAAGVGGFVYYRRKNSEPERQRENGGNLKQKTDDHATEETKLDDPLKENSSSL